ncbi:MAG: LacI family DNA-binding transcriptional regulator [Pseudomonadota bacterium]
MTNIRDVAHAAGVSVATVSRVLHTPEKVSEQVRETVLKAVKDTNYQPNMMARRLRTKKAHAVMVIVSHLTNPFYATVISGIQSVAQQRGYTVLLGESGGDPEVEDQYAAFASSKQVDGVIQLGERLPSSLKPLVEREHPFPFVNACEFWDPTTYPTVGIDNRKSFADVTRYVLDHGHRIIAHIKGPDDNPVTHHRVEGYKEALINAGLTPDPDLIVDGDFSIEAGSRAAAHLLSLASPPTAIVSANDEMAIGVIRTIKESGQSVPSDISVAGFDDIHFAKYTDPPLTTVSQPAADIGGQAAALLFDAIDNKLISNRTIRIPTNLVVRDSVKAI